MFLKTGVAKRDILEAQLINERLINDETIFIPCFAGTKNIVFTKTSLTSQWSFHTTCLLDSDAKLNACFFLSYNNSTIIHYTRVLMIK